MPKTMFEKIWDSHVVSEAPGDTTILYIDRHLVHEVTSPQAFAGLRLAGRSVHRPDATIGVLDHNIPTVPGRRMLDVVDDLCVEIHTPRRMARWEHWPLASAPARWSMCWQRNASYKIGPKRCKSASRAL